MTDICLMTETRALPSVPVPVLAAALEASRTQAEHAGGVLINGAPILIRGTPIVVRVIDYRAVRGELTDSGSVATSITPRKCYRVIVTRHDRDAQPLQMFVDEFARPLWGWEPGEVIAGR